MRRTISTEIMTIQLELFPADTDFSLMPPSRRVYDGLRQYFEMTYNDKVMDCFGFVDGLMSAMMDRPIINAAKLDKYLIETHYPEYTGENTSMSEAIVKFYGAEADNWLTRYLY